MINNFLQGALCEAVSNNYDAVFIPSTYPARQQLEALAVDKSGDVAFQAGRVTGAAANVAQGIIEMGVGAGAMVAGLGGGALTSPSGGGALAGARVAVAGAAVAGHGLLVGAKGMEGAMEGFSNVLRNEN